MTLRLLAPLFLSSLLGCTDEGAIEDAIDDTFMTEDAKADAFGVEDWSPDGMAVLRLVSSASAAKLEDQVGLSARVAKSIVAHRATLSGREYHDLAELDAAKYVGVTVFKRLLRYVADEKLFRTSIRIPLVVDTARKVSLTSFNDEARSVGLQGFATYTFVDAETKFSEKMAKYDERLRELARRANIEIRGEMMMYNSWVSEYSVGSLKPCYLGDALEVPDVLSSQTDGMMGDMYSIWGYRYQRTSWVYDDQDASEMGFDSMWSSYDTRSKSILLQSSNNDDGSPAGELIPPCR